MNRAQKLLMGDVLPPMYKRYLAIVEYNNLCKTFEKLLEEPCNYEIFKDLMMMFYAAHPKSRSFFEKKICEHFKQ